MLRTLEARVERDGSVHLLQSIELSNPCRAILIVLDEAPKQQASSTAQSSEHALADDWLRQEEDDAWAYLQRPW